MNVRRCGSCTVCCIAPALPQLGKPCWQPCKNLNTAGNGCSVYDDRPTPCRTFRCAWLCDPGIPDEYRPDHCGLMLVGRPNNVLQVWEVGTEWEGSALQAFLARFDHGMRVKLAFKPEENHTIIGSRATKHRSADGRTEINLAYTITMPDGEVIDRG